MKNFIDQLKEMGFPEEQCKEAVDATNNESLETALNWIVGKNEQNNSALGQESSTPPTVASYKCDECLKILVTESELEYHAAKTGHAKFSESTEIKKPLTEAERKEQEKRILEIIRVKKAEREKREKEEEIEREKKRRETGKTLVEIKEKFQEEEMKREIEARKREKKSDEEYREKLKAEIAREREEKKERERQKLSGHIAPPEPVITAPVKNTIRTDECRLQIRLPCGTPLVQTFKSCEPLSAVYLYVSQNWPGGVDPFSISLSMTYPRKNFDEGDKQKRLDDLSLCPSASLAARLKA